MTTAIEPVSSDPFWPWLAGFVDGEGSIGLNRERDPRKHDDYFAYRPALQVVNTDRFSIEYIAQKIGSGSVVTVKPRNEKHKTQWRYHLRERHAVERVLTAIAPHLRIKLPQTVWLLQYIRNRMMAPRRGWFIGYEPTDHFIYQQLQALNRRGPDAANVEAWS